MRCLCFIVLVLGALLASAQSSAPPESFAGCYELRVPGWHLLSETNGRLPRQFRLTKRPFVTSPSRRFAAENQDSRIRWKLSGLSSWTVKDDGMLQIVWSTGFVGYDIRLSRSEDEFVGRAHFFTDTDAILSPAMTPWNSIGVAIRRANCENPAELALRSRNNAAARCGVTPLQSDL